LAPATQTCFAAIETVGAIARAGRVIGVSYKKTCTLINELNNTFSGPVVETSIGWSRRWLFSPYPHWAQKFRRVAENRAMRRGGYTG